MGKFVFYTLVEWGYASELAWYSSPQGVFLTNKRMQTDVHKVMVNMIKTL